MYIKDTVCILQVTVGNAAYQCSCVHYGWVKKRDAMKTFCLILHR